MASLIWGDPNMGFVGSIDGWQIYRQEAWTLYPPSTQASPW